MSRCKWLGPLAQNLTEEPFIFEIPTPYHSPFYLRYSSEVCVKPTAYGFNFSVSPPFLLLPSSSLPFLPLSFLIIPLPYSLLSPPSFLLPPPFFLPPPSPLPPPLPPSSSNNVVLLNNTAGNITSQALATDPASFSATPEVHILHISPSS